MFLLCVTLLLTVNLSLQYAIPVNDTSRIYKGAIALANTIPYQVAVFTTYIDDTSSFCGGSLITTKFVLTAAHCMEDVVSLTVLLGANSVNLLEPNTVVMKSTKFKMHDDYNTITVENDIGLIELPQPVVLSKYIATVKLCKKGENPKLYYNKYGQVTGWGITSDSAENVSDVLKLLRVRIVKEEKCIGFKLFSNNLCGYGDFSGSACMGDSGSPLVLENHQIGLVSYGANEGCTLGKPHIYTKITSYIPWIESNSDYKSK